ncbi:MAG: DinB family protein [Mucilaginibacter polytrichastri]|nr:DinB family protein [Mucilaginibacter polytrichastri]
MNDTTFAEGLIAELEAEAPATKNCLKEIKSTFFSYKPHPRSMEMGYLALLVAEIPLWIPYTIAHGEIDFATFKHHTATGPDDLVKHFEENMAKAKEELSRVKDGDLDANFDLKQNGEVMFSSTKRESIESMINHMVHHRGQLTVYMRLNDIPVPSIYGPSADTRL